ncbi:MAG: tetratricopeptide repeat protein, partial [Bacteroidales bacterium]
QTSEAIADFDKALSIKPSLFEAIVQKAIALYQGDKEKDAFELINNAISKEPNQPALYYGRGILNNSKQKFEKALSDFNKSLELNADYNPFYLYLARGTAYLGMKEYEMALADFSKAIEIVPKSAIAYSSRAKVYYETEKYNEAIADYEKTIELNPDNAAAYFNQGMAYFKIDDKRNACERFHKACSMGNNNACKMILINCMEERKK